MSPTKEIGRQKKHSLQRQLRSRGMFAYPSPETDQEFDVSDPKQIYQEGWLLSGRDAVQPNWGRIQLAAREEYAVAFGVVDATPPQFMGETAANPDILLIPHHSRFATKAEPVSDRPFDEILREHLSEYLSTLGDVEHQSVIARLNRASHVIEKLRILKEWINQLASEVQRGEDENNDSVSKGTVLERLEGFVEQIDGPTAYVRLKSEHGDELFGEYPAQELAAEGIVERRRFLCRTVEVGGEVRVEFEAIPDEPVSPEEEDALDRRLDELLADGELDGDY